MCFHGDDVIDDVTGWPQSFHLYSCLGEVGSGSKLQILAIIVIVLHARRRSQWKTLFQFAGQRSMSQAYWVTLALRLTITLSILGSSRWNKQWNVRNSYSHVATATKIWFHFQFPRSTNAAFGGLIGWLSNWKCKFSCRKISNKANYLKYNYFRDGDGADNVTWGLWKFSDFCSRHTVGVTDDDIMFHTLVIFVTQLRQLSLLWDDLFINHEHWA